MRLVMLLFSLLLITTQCTQRRAKSTPDTFTGLTTQLLEDYWALFPSQATYQGIRTHDTVITLPNTTHRDAVRSFAHSYLDQLSHYAMDSLSTRQQMEYQVVRNLLQKLVWQVDTLQEHAWNAAYYNVGPSTGILLKGRFAPLNERLLAIYDRLPYISEYYATAQQQLTRPTKEHIEMGIQQNEGTLALVRDELADSLAVSGLDNAVKAQFQERIDNAVAAIKGYLAFLEQQLATRQDFASFRLGEELYNKLFAYELVSAYTPEELLAVAEAQLEETHINMLRLTQKLWPTYFDEPLSTLDFSHIQRLIDTLSTNHAEPANFLSAIQTQMDTLVNFVREKDLVFLDSTKPLVVRQAPGYLQGIALVSISAPGPYDKQGDTYYNVNDLTQYDAATAESWLREYNDYMLQILNIHEAIPGHYVQLAYANESPSQILSIFGSNTMIEGWACYAERMMLEAGYGADSDELQLLYYKWYLRIIANTIIDIGVHTREMTKEEVMTLLVDNAFQEKAEAENKWQRVQRTQVQLCSYFNGLMEILDLRDEMRVRDADAFTLRDFHDQFLGYGSAPVTFIRQAMTGD